MQTHRHLRTLTLVAAAAGALALSACGREDDRTVGQKIDSAIAKTEQKAEEVKAEVKAETAEALMATERAADRVADKIDRAADSVSHTAADAAVTASINAELARDPDLSALKIDVDTTDGRVLLSGKAPSDAARDRATRLAQSVSGVTSVENRLQVGS